VNSTPAAPRFWATAPMSRSPGSTRTARATTPCPWFTQAGSGESTISPERWSHVSATRAPSRCPPGSGVDLRTHRRQPRLLRPLGRHIRPVHLKPPHTLRTLRTLRTHNRCNGATPAESAEQEERARRARRTPTRLLLPGAERRPTWFSQSFGVHSSSSADSRRGRFTGPFLLLR
jgi:hypothetical protein